MTNLRSSSDGSMRHPPSEFASNSVFRPVRMLVSNPRPDQLTGETPELIDHGEPLGHGLGAQNLGHLVERYAMIDKFWRLASQLIRARIAHEHPDWSEDRIRRELARRMSHGAV